MRKRFTLIAGLAALVATAIPVSAAMGGETVTGPDGNTQSMEAKISPKALYKKTSSPGSLFVDVKTGTTNPASPAPSPAVHDVIDFDQNLSLASKGLPTCNAAKLQNTSTEAAERACGNAIIGKGEATTLLPLGTLYTEPTVVTAFNGVPQGGKPVVLLHAYGTSPVQTTLVLVGVVSNYNKEGYGPRLDVTIPPIAGGSGAITDFKVTIKKSWTYKGKKMSFINAKCPASKKLKYRGAFTYKDGTTIEATHTQPCTPKAEPKKTK
ncbi:MAG: hypothetical protein BGO11_03165 [Solirubrobacterales bacterium 70-9]|nr:MAG: hypothetical protein BGO11_03165 [Solirubrobacterales bacterium 70-9]